ncbi:MAG: murein L,D-transpeptidase family protein [Blastocatellia bacterium]
MKNRKGFRILASLGILGLALSAGRPSRGDSTMEPGMPNSYRILVRKKDRRLDLYRIENGREKLAKTYEIVLGGNPTGTKLRQGDSATPEGEYYITHKNAKSKFYLSLGVSYPSVADADRGLKAGLISRAEHDAIAAAIRRGGKPPQNTKLGGDIFIHGGGTGRLFGLIRDWTLGCVAMENQDIKELFDATPVRTPVRIVP